MTRIINILLLFTIIMAGSCREPYWPELKDYEDLLVVDGLITDNPGPYEVKLSYSTTVQNPYLVPFKGATVTIVDNEGFSETLTETGEGVYTTDPAGIQGKVGQSYRVIITTPGGTTYASPFQEIKPPVGIADIYTEEQTIQTENDYYPLYGLQFYLDTEAAPQDTNYLTWRIYGDYKYRVDYLIRFVYDRRQLTVFPNPDSLYVCYGHEKITDIIAMKTDNLVEPRLSRLPLTFVNTETKKLSIRYSLLVKQLSLTQDAYHFYSDLAEMNTQEGALYNTQPFQVRGNVENLDDPDEIVLGYFLAAGMVEKRIFVDRPTNLPFRYGICELTERDYDAYRYIGLTSSTEWPLYVTTNSDGYRALPEQGCIDCRRMGGSIIKPDFWED
ncbi:MAG: DUF4249 domain-containing protein [bacterium]